MILILACSDSQHWNASTELVRIPEETFFTSLLRYVLVIIFSTFSQTFVPVDVIVCQGLYAIDMFRCTEPTWLQPLLFSFTTSKSTMLASWKECVLVVVFILNVVGT